jgi:NAD kinase
MAGDYMDSELKSVSSIDKELEELVKKQGARVKVIGCGGGGGNSVSRMREIGIKGCEVIAINTDAQDLLNRLLNDGVLCSVGAFPQREACLERQRRGCSGCRRFFEQRCDRLYDG